MVGFDLKAFAVFVLLPVCPAVDIVRGCRSNLGKPVDHGIGRIGFLQGSDGAACGKTALADCEAAYDQVILCGQIRVHIDASACCDLGDLDRVRLFIGRNQLGSVHTDDRLGKVITDDDCDLAVDNVITRVSCTSQNDDCQFFRVRADCYVARSIHNGSLTDTGLYIMLEYCYGYRKTEAVCSCGNCCVKVYADYFRIGIRVQNDVFRVQLDIVCSHTGDRFGDRYKDRSRYSARILGNGSAGQDRHHLFSCISCQIDVAGCGGQFRLISHIGIGLARRLLEQDCSAEG